MYFDNAVVTLFTSLAGSFISWCWCSEDAHPGHDPAANGSGGGEVWNGEVQGRLQFHLLSSGVVRWCSMSRWCWCARESVIWSCKSHGLAPHSISFLVIKCAFNLSVFNPGLCMFFFWCSLFLWKESFRVFLLLSIPTPWFVISACPWYMAPKIVARSWLMMHSEA